MDQKHDYPSIVPAQHEHPNRALQLVKVPIELVYGTVNDGQKILIGHRNRHGVTRDALADNKASRQCLLEVYIDA